LHEVGDLFELNVKLRCQKTITSLISGVFPTRLKYSIITPLHKKGDKNNVSNYRPISLLTSF